MFWCRIAELIVLSGNNLRVFNETTINLTDFIYSHLNDTLHVRYLYLLDNDHRFAKRIAKELVS